ATRLLTPFRQAVMVLRWFVDGTRIAQLARDNGLSKRTGYRYLREGIDALKDSVGESANRPPGLVVVGMIVLFVGTRGGAGCRWSRGTTVG
ncbi:hypothetical protein ROS62_30750, partial [Streptomyces sp. DSM 41972]|nr:hypothetical protein [Streptomyces sp. DSM 41972]